MGTRPEEGPESGGRDRNDLALDSRLWTLPSRLSTTLSAITRGRRSAFPKKTLKCACQSFWGTPTAKHYLQITEDHFKAAQNAAQSGAEIGDYSGHQRTGNVETSGKSGAVNQSQFLTTSTVGDTRLELVTPSLSS